MKKQNVLLILALLGLFPVLRANVPEVLPLPITDVSQQSRKITGVIVDDIGEPVIGANVVEKGTLNGTMTDFDGKFSLDVSTNAILTISYIGYISQEIAVGNQSVISVALREDTQTLDEVVVVGFGTQKKVNVTGSVGVATAKDLEARPVQNAVLALQGVVPGLNISNKGVGGELNATKSIDIRGTGTIGKGSSGDPLILIDGMEGDINTVNPQDIESISVLKDAAASSIYGSRAPFGVILVTTKSGKEGRASITYNNNFRFSTPIMPFNMQNSWEFVNYFDDANFNTSNNHLYSESYMQRVKDYFYGVLDPTDVTLALDNGKWDEDYANGNVNWLKEYLKDWSPSQEHNVSVSGGNNKLTYYLSANYLTQDGFMRYGTDEYDRYTITGKISAQLTDYIKVDYSSRFTRTDYSRPTYWNDDFYNQILRRARPVRPINDPNGYYMAYIHYIPHMEDGGRHKEQNDANYQQLRMTITPIKDWNIIAEFNMKNGSEWTHWDQFPVYSYYADGLSTYVPTTTSVTNSQVYEKSYKYTFLNPNVYSNYTKTFNKHTFAATVGFQAEKMLKRQMNAQRADAITQELPVLNLTTSTDSYTINGEYQEWATAGFFGRINYDYDGKYLAEVNLRYDGSSRFRKGNRWVWTPSASLGWNIAREEFWEPLVNVVGTLKLRGSYGVLANQNTTGWYPTYETMTVGTNGYWLIDGAKPNRAWAPGLVSSSLTWEKIKTTNIGVDFGLLNNRLTGYFDWFNRKTENMVGPGVELPSILGTSVPNTNNTDLKTYGFEFEIGWRDRIGKVNYGVRLNISDSQTKILRYGNPTGTLSGYGDSSYLEGELMGNIYGYTTIGIARTQEEMDAHLAKVDQSSLGSNWGAGDIMYADLNGDGKISTGDNTIHDMGDQKKLGNSTPRFRTGIHLDAAWNGFDIQMFWQGVLKRDFAPGNNSMVYWGTNSSGEWWSTAFVEHLDYFRDSNTASVVRGAFDENLDSFYPRATFSNKNTRTQSRYIENASYMRLKNLQIGYTFPRVWTDKVLLQNLRIFLSGENLLTITNLRSVLDPESVGVGKQGGMVYPLSRTYSFGLSVNF